MLYIKIKINEKILKIKHQGMVSVGACILDHDTADGLMQYREQ